jgi:ATP-dependent DNA ligase
MTSTIPRGTYPATHGAPIVEIGGIIYAVEKSSNEIEADGSKTKKYWQGHVLRSPMNRWFTASSSWRATATGLSKVVWSAPYYAEPTNEGRANFRDNKEQAFFEFDSMVNKQTDKRLSEKPLPMLAQKYQDRAKHITFPCAVQPKFDGMRVLYNGIEAWSRGNKNVIPEVFAHLEFDTQGYTIDGELILPGNLKVNKTMEAAKKFRPGLSDKLLYRVYDIVDATVPFRDRYALLVRLVNAAANKNIIIADTLTAFSDDDIKKCHESFVLAGFEGTMIRNLDGLYTINKRSNDLQKFKDFVDEEFLIVDVIPAGGGSSADVGKFVCVTESGERFESTATGDYETRHDYLVNKQNYVGKYARVKYREMSGKNSVPFHSNVLEIRETKEDGY